MKKLFSLFLLLISSYCVNAQFLEQDLVSARAIKREANKLVQLFLQNAPRSTEEFYIDPRDTVFSILHMTEVQFDSPVNHYIYGEIQFYYGYEIITLVDGRMIFYLSLVKSDCCDFVSIFISENNDRSQMNITLIPLYEEKETLFFSYQDNAEYDIEIATAMAYIDPQVKYGEKPLQITEISTKTFLEKFKIVCANIYP